MAPPRAVIGVSADCNVTRIAEVKVIHLGEYGGFASRRH